MKRITSFVLTLIMILSMFSTVSAASIADTTYYVPNPLELGLSVEVFARESGKSEQYTSTNYEIKDVDSAKGIDYKATLDMSPIRDLFDEGFMQTVFLTDAQAQEEFNKGKVTSSIKVIINYPETADIKVKLNTAGVLDAGGIFDEVSRTVDGNKVTITYNNNKIHTNKVLTAQELMTNKETYLKDISFTLEDSVEYKNVGSHKVSVTLAGSTTIEFASKTQVVTYHGQASNMVNLIAPEDEGETKPTEHKLLIVPYKPATCTETGQTESYICSIHNSYECGADGVLAPTRIPALNHMSNGESMKVFLGKVDATCTTDGMEAHWTCTLCKKDFDSQVSDIVKDHEEFIIPKTGHKSVTLNGYPAMCEEHGFTDGKICETCGIILVPRKIIDKLPHTIVPINTAVSATCTEDGITAGEKCRVCNLVITPSLPIPATGHNFGDWVTIPATETSTGSKTRTCLNECGTVETIVIPKLEHNHIIDDKLDVITKAPTCTNTGKKDRYCACGERMEHNVSVPALGHKLSKVEAVKATCIEKGKIEHWTCVNGCNQNFRDKDGKNKLNSIHTQKDKSNHIELITLAAIEATCEKHGLEEGQKCNACHTVTVKQEKTEKTKHSPETLQWIEAHEPSCEQPGFDEHFHCAVCNKDFHPETLKELKEKDFTRPALGHNLGPAEDIDYDSLEDGHYDAIRYCERYEQCGHEVDVKVPAEDVCTHTVDVAGHITDAGVYEIDKEPTCTETGLEHKICLLCGGKYEENTVLPALGHDYVWIEMVESTCHKKGTRGHYKCSECNELFDDEKKVITDIKSLEKELITEHRFNPHPHKPNSKICYWCHEIFSIKTVDTEEIHTDMFEVVNAVHIKQDNNDISREEILVDQKDVRTVESKITIEERDESSDKIDEKITGKKPKESTIVEKIPFDVSVEKVFTYENEDQDIEVYKETMDFLIIKINLPEQFRDKLSFIVFRHHKTTEGQDTYDIIRESNSPAEERIEVSSDKTHILLYVKKFSEYAMAAYSDEVPQEKSSSGSSGYTKYTLRFNANGGTTVDTITVKHGQKISAPVSTREGYILEGWYTENTFINKFDFNNPITVNMNLYAKWIPVSSAIDCLKTRESGCPCYNYTDLDAHAWYHDGVHYVLENGIMIGVELDKFAPFGSLTRAMLVTMLWRSEDKPQAKEDATFKDLGEGLYYVDAIKWAAENGVVEGYSDTEFGPNDAITREQIATIMYRYAQYKGYDVSAKADITSFKDYENISGYAISAMQYAVGSDLMEGRTETTLNPGADATRAEMATVLYRFLTKINK